MCDWYNPSTGSIIVLEKNLKYSIEETMFL